MEKQKQHLDYESPTTELFNLRIESAILTGSDFSETQKNEYFIIALEEDL